MRNVTEGTDWAARHEREQQRQQIYMQQQSQQAYMQQQHQGMPPQTQMMQPPEGQPMYGIPAQYPQQQQSNPAPLYQTQYPPSYQPQAPPPEPIYYEQPQTQTQPQYQPQQQPTAPQYNNGEKSFVQATDIDYSWRNVFWAILFYISVIATCFGTYKSFNSGTSDHYHFNHHNENFFDVIQPSVIFTGIGTGAIFTVVWLAIIMCCASVIIKLCLILSPVLLIGAGLGIFMWLGNDGIVGIVALLILAVFLAIYAYCVWSKIPFATVCLEIAVSTFKQFKAPLFVNVFMMFLAVK